MAQNKPEVIWEKVMSPAEGLEHILTPTDGKATWPQDVINGMFLGDVLGVHCVYPHLKPDDPDFIHYACYFNSREEEPFVLKLPKEMSKENKVTALRTALRLHYGSNRQRQKSTTTKT